MTDEREEWGPWIEHDGKGCPCVGMVVWDERKNAIKKWVGSTSPISMPAPNQAIYIAGGGGSWTWQRGYNRIIRYRIRKPRALTQLRDMVENLPAPEREREDT